MSLIAKTDYYKSHLAAISGLVIIGSDENRTASTVQARNEKGDIVAEEMIGENIAPKCSYVLSAEANLSAISCFGNTLPGAGDLSTRYFVLTSINIDTAAGSAPSINAAGEEVPTSSHTDCYYTPQSGILNTCHHAQNICSAYIMETSGCYVTNASYSIECSMTKATRNGETITYDISDGKMTCNLTIQSTISGKPGLSAGEGWNITSPMSQSNGDSAYPTWSCTLTRNLKHYTDYKTEAEAEAGTKTT